MPPSISKFVILSVTLIFFSALFWAKEQDPFSRKWIILETPDHHPFKCVVVLPKDVPRSPVIIYAHDINDDLINDGNNIRQMAEMGLVVVCLQYDQESHTTFNFQFESLINYLSRQTWADTNAIAWVGRGLGANKMSGFLLNYPQEQPKLFVQYDDNFEFYTNSENEKLLHCRILLICDKSAQMSPLGNINSQLEVKTLSSDLRNLAPDHLVIFRCIGEYCLERLSNHAWQDYNSFNEWRAAAPKLWVCYLLPATFVIGWLILWCKSISHQRQLLQRRLLWLIVILLVSALTVATLVFIARSLRINKTTLYIAKAFLIPSKQRGDLDYLVQQSIWNGRKLKALLAQIDLASYNRQLVNWNLDEGLYQEYVLSPVITGRSNEQFDWRRPLWEEFYPRIRRTTSPQEAARIVARHLRERITVVDQPNLSREVSSIWLRQIADEAGFEIISVAALRSIGIPARLNENGEAQFWDGTEWKQAPKPIVFQAL